MINKKQKGAVSTIILILAVILIILTVVVYVVIKLNTSKKAAVLKVTTTTTNSSAPVVPPLVTDTTVGNTRFVVQFVQDLGNVIQSPKPQFGKDLVTTERYIKVVVGAQNKGKVNIAQNTWDIGNIVDSEGRVFVSIDSQAYYFLPNPNLCGSLLKPEFDLVPCVSYFEVSKESKGLKVEVNAYDSSSKKKTALLDLDLK